MSSISLGHNFKLSYGALQNILDGEAVENVVLQVLGYKEIPGSNNTRFRLLLNDGVDLFSYAILSTQLNKLIYDKNLEKYTIFKLKNYAFNQLVSNQKVIFCIDVEIIFPGSEVNVKIEKDNSETVINQHGNSLLTSLSVQIQNQSFNLESLPSTSDVAQNWDTARNNHTQSPSYNCFISSISNITPYHTKWRIKARVTYKTPITSYNNIRGQGKFFSFYLLDSSGEIKATAFNQNAEKFFESLEVNKIYLITKANVKHARENCPVKCDFELIFESNTQIEPYFGDDASVPVSSFNFHTIAEIMCLPTNSYTDVIGISMHISDTDIIVTKLNKEVVKRNLILFDDSEKSITVTLWGSNAENFMLDSNNSVIAIKNAKVTCFRGCSLTVTSMSMIYVNPKIPKADQLRLWFQNLTPAVASQSFSCDISTQKASQTWKTIGEVYFESSRNSEIPLYYNTKATIVTVKKENCMYQACPVPGCLKKVIDLNNGLYKCSKCNKDYDTFNWTLRFSLEIADFSGSHWTVAFKETAENLIGMNSEDLSGIKSEDEDKFYDILCSLNLKSYTFKMRSNVEAFNEDTHLKTLILNFNLVDPLTYSKKLLEDIKKLSKVINNISK